MAAEGDPCDCRYCPPDPNLTGSYTGDDVSVLWNYVSNAYRGNLLLCPGGDNGQIGGLLHQLDPPQHYSHMGIFVANHDLIRHCTAVPSRLTAKEYYSSSLLGVQVPADGLPVDHVQYGWPGAITQSVEQAFYADRYAAQDLLPPGETARYTDPQTGVTLYGENITGKPGDPPVAAGSTMQLDIAVTELPKCLRNVLVSGRIRIDDVYLTGVDHDEQTHNATLFVQHGVASFDTDSGLENRPERPRGRSPAHRPVQGHRRSGRRPRSAGV